MRPGPAGPQSAHVSFNLLKDIVPLSNKGHPADKDKQRFPCMNNHQSGWKEPDYDLINLLNVKSFPVYFFLKGLVLHIRITFVLISEYIYYYSPAHLW